MEKSSAKKNIEKIFLQDAVIKGAVIKGAVIKGAVFKGAVFKGSALPLKSGAKLSSHIPELDQIFDGGIGFGQLVEWGMPLRSGGRQVILRFLKSATKGWNQGESASYLDPQLCLWVSSAASLSTPYPPYWQAQGVDLRRVYFASATKPVEQLRPFFFDPLFRLIILDDPQILSKDDVTFLAQRARANGQIIMLLRNFYLSNRYGNIWAKLRINCWQAPEFPYSFHVAILRGATLPYLRSATLPHLRGAKQSAAVKSFSLPDQDERLQDKDVAR